MRRFGALLLSCAALVASPGRAAAATPAASVISNVAQASLVIDGTATRLSSNVARSVVAEVLDVIVTPLQATVSPPVGGRSSAVGFRVTNTGNGREAFALASGVPGGADDFAPAACRLMLDVDGDGVLDDRDVAYASGVNDPVLAPGQSTTVFVVCDLPEGAAGAAHVVLTARALVGIGRPGTVFQGRGADGVDAVVGTTTAAAQANSGVYIGAVKAELVKSQSVLDPAGGSAAVPGSTVTYTLAARFVGTGSVTGVRVDDPFPTGCAYVAGSLKLDGAAVADAGAVDSAGVHLALGVFAAPADHLVSFSVHLN